MRNKLLTVGIPTYNRPEEIQQTVRKLLPQITDEVIIRIRDNCSPVPVSTLFSQEELTKIVVVRNKVNIGGDANIAGVLYDCDTPWCWDLGDDDEVAPDAIQTILDTIKKHSDSVFIKFNCKYDLTTIGIEDFVQKFKERGMYGNILFISTSIFNVNYLKDSLCFYYKYLSTMNGQVVMLLKHLENMPKSKITFSSRDIILKGNDPQWVSGDFIMPLPLTLYALRRERKLLGSTLFKSMISACLFNCLFFCKSKKEQWYLLMYLVKNFGIYKIFICNYVIIARKILSVFLPYNIYTKLVGYIKKRI